MFLVRVLLLLFALAVNTEGNTASSRRLENRGGRHLSNGCFGGICDTSATNQVEEAKTVVLREGYSIRSRTITKTTEDQICACFWKCQDNSKCKAFVYHTDTKLCEQKQNKYSVRGRIKCDDCIVEDPLGDLKATCTKQTLKRPVTTRTETKRKSAAAGEGFGTVKGSHGSGEGEGEGFGTVKGSHGSGEGEGEGFGTVKGSHGSGEGEGEGFGTVKGSHGSGEGEGSGTVKGSHGSGEGEGSGTVKGSHGSGEGEGSGTVKGSHGSGEGEGFGTVKGSHGSGEGEGFGTVKGSHGSGEGEGSGTVKGSHGSGEGEGSGTVKGSHGSGEGGTKKKSRRGSSSKSKPGRKKEIGKESEEETTEAQPGTGTGKRSGGIDTGTVHKFGEGSESEGGSSEAEGHASGSWTGSVKITEGSPKKPASPEAIPEPVITEKKSSSKGSKVSEKKKSGKGVHSSRSQPPISPAPSSTVPSPQEPTPAFVETTPEHGPSEQIGSRHESTGSHGDVHGGSSIGTAPGSEEEHGGETCGDVYQGSGVWNYESAEFTMPSDAKGEHCSVVTTCPPSSDAASAPGRSHPSAPGGGSTHDQQQPKSRPGFHYIGQTHGADDSCGTFTEDGGAWTYESAEFTMPAAVDWDRCSMTVVCYD